MKLKTLLFLALAAPGLAQGPIFNGAIKDSLGRPLAGVQVQLLDKAGKVLLQLVSDEQGEFSLPAVPEGAFVVKFLKEGFNPGSRRLPEPGAGPLAIVLGEEEELVISVKERQLTGASVTPSGANQYTMTTKDIDERPAGQQSSLSQLLLAMPGVALDQNQQVHIRDQHNNAHYRINGITIPLSMYAEPAFASFVNPQFIKRVDLLTGILPAQYGFTGSGGVIDITTKDGELKGGSLATTVGMRGKLQEMIQYGGTEGKFNYYFSGLYDSGNTAFSQASPGSNPLHNQTKNAQGFGYFNYDLDDTTRLSLITSLTHSSNQLPNSNNLTPQFNLAGFSDFPSTRLNSTLNFHDALGVLALSGKPSQDLDWQVAYSVHSLTQDFRPDIPGELIYQGVASTVTSGNRDQSLQGDVNFRIDDHKLSAGFYAARYNILSNTTSRVFPVDASGNQASNIPLRIVNNFPTGDSIQSLYVNDLWQMSPEWKLNLGVRADMISGFTDSKTISPTVNLIYNPTPDTTLHLGYAHYANLPTFQAFSPRAQASYDGTTNAQQPGQVNPIVQRDKVYDFGFIQRIDDHFSLSLDNYYEWNRGYGDVGQFGAVPIYVNINYDHGYTWGSEMSLRYRNQDFSSYLNFTLGRSIQFGVSAGQYNFAADALAYITRNGFILDHQPLYGVSSGIAYTTKPWTFSLGFLYSSGLRGGFADNTQLPAVIQADLGITRTFTIDGLGECSNRLTILNAFDRINLVRPQNGVGTFQAAYGPRFTVYDTFTIPIP